jgi:leader peptidase (prepilin peptidase)/N-methyltransferase
MSELLGGLVYAGLGIHVLLNFRTPGVDIVMFAEIIVIAVFFATMLYLAIYDIQTFSVPSRFVTVLLVGSIAVSVLLNSLRLLGGSLSSTFPLSSSDHLFTGLLLGLLVYILILLTKQRGMGEGDIYIAAVIGLYLGWPNGLMAMYFAIITGGIFGLFYALKLGKVKNVLIPFVPFLLLGSVISIIIGSELFRVVFYG